MKRVVTSNENAGWHLNEDELKVYCETTACSLHKMMRDVYVATRQKSKGMEDT